MPAVLPHTAGIVGHWPRTDTRISEAATADKGPKPAMTASRRSIYFGVDTRQVELVSTWGRMVQILEHIAESGEIHALDFETTTLWPTDDDASYIRITSISGPTGNYLFDHGVDKYSPNSFHAVADEVIRAATWAVFNAGFEQRWMDFFLPREAALVDVGLMSKARLGGRPLSLAQMVKRDLEKSRDKELQSSDWSAPHLTTGQYEYAAEDAVDTYDLFVKWKAELDEHGLHEGFYVFNDAVRGTTVMEDNGLYLDIEHHQTLITMWEKRRQAAEKAVRRITDDATLPNIRSKQQISKLISSVLDAEALAAWPKTEKTEQLDTSRKVLRQVSFRSPYPFSRWLAALMVFNRADKYLGTYGEKLVTIQRLSGKIRTRFNIAQAVTGRYSSSEPNLQNIPRNPMVRRSFIARPGAIMLLVDYSGIELRVLAELSDDDQLRQDVIYGDVHAENAVIQNGFDRERFFAALKSKDPKAKEMRARSKAFSFQLTYGAGIPALALALRSTDDAARSHVDAWAARYPKAYNYRYSVYEVMKATGFIHTAGQRSIYVNRVDRSLPVASNYPVQGSAGDVMYRAIYHVEELYSEFRGPARPFLLASIHDELLSEIRFAITAAAFNRHYDRYVKEAKETLELKKTAMAQGWLDIFPGSSVDNLMEAEVGFSWAAKP